MSERTRELKKKYFHKVIVSRREPGVRSKLGYRPEVKLDIERARLYTESYTRTDGEAECIRQAKALENVLDNKTIFIFEDERIVGNYGYNPAAITCYPELEERELLIGVTEGDFRDMLNDEDRKAFVEICHYWGGKSIGDRVRASIPEDAANYYFVNGACQTLHHRRMGVPLPSYERILKVGLNGLIDQAEKRLAELKESVPEDLDTRRYIESRYFLEAMLIGLRAAIRFAHRFSVLALEMAEKEARPWRKKELEEIARACDWVPANPPRTFYEALQSWFFMHLIINYFETQNGGAGCRFDCLMYPYYKRDLEAGRITREEAQELLEFLWLRINEGVKVSSPEELAPGQGAVNLFNFNIGGVTPEGEDASNELSFIMIDASMGIRTLEPLLALRYHPKINQDLVLKAIDCIRTGVGYPAIFNDSALIPWLVNRGIPLEDARNYGITACVELTLQGKAFYTNTSPSVGFLNLAKCFEIALHQGKDPMYGNQLGCVTPDPTTFRDISDVMQAYLKQVNFISGKMAEIACVAEVVKSKYDPLPFTSALIDGCIETAQSCMNEFYGQLPFITTCAPVNVADSLAAIKKFVFEDKRVSMQELLDILKNDWEGNEALRQEFINKAPKFGNDDDFVDFIARDVFHKSQEEVQKHAEVHGTPFSLEGSVAGVYGLWGRKTGATPDGRKSKETLADGAGSPMSGRDKSGPTAVLKSLGKIQPTPWPTLVNQRFFPQYLDEDNKKAFAQYLKTFADLGISHIQFNVVDQATLFDAQQHPEKYNDLIVRVAGYSAHFVDLSKVLQDQIMARTVLTF